MKIDIGILRAADPEDEVRSLHDWLRLEDDLHQSRVELTSPRIRDGEMGMGMSAITVALGGGGAITVLANSISIWLRNRGTDLTLKISGPKREIVIDARRARNPKELIEMIVTAAGDEW